MTTHAPSWCSLNKGLGTEGGSSHANFYTPQIQKAVRLCPDQLPWGSGPRVTPQVQGTQTGSPGVQGPDRLPQIWGAQTISLGFRVALWASREKSCEHMLEDLRP